MTKLFFIGNGFDLAHNLPTKYLNFKEYLENNYQESENINPTINISSTIMPDGEEKYDVYEVVSLLNKSISEASNDDPEWNNFERYLGELDFTEYFEDIASIYENDEGPNLFHEAYAQEDFSKVLLDTIHPIKDLFSNWVNSIDTNNISLKENFYKLIDYKNDKFMLEPEKQSTQKKLFEKFYFPVFKSDH